MLGVFEPASSPFFVVCCLGVGVGLSWAGCARLVLGLGLLLGAGASRVWEGKEWGVGGSVCAGPAGGGVR